MPDAKPTVLVIDDDPDLRASVGRLLRSVGLEAQLFASISDFLKSDPPDGPTCLVLDVRLPGQSGLDFQRESEKALADLRERFGSLSPREREIMIHVAQGRLSKQIAGDIGIAEATVKVHRSRAMRKMNARSLPELGRMADRLKLVSEKTQSS